jgi:glycosyltransferase involved in cell wall biosynthesis
MDGASEDGTRELLEEMAGRSSWLRMRSEPDTGFYHALNKGLAMARGKYYVVAGADDVFFPDCLASFARIATASDVDVVMARVEKDGHTIGGFHPRRAWLGHASAFRGSHSIGMLLRTALHGRFGAYSMRFPLLADAYFLKQLLNARDIVFQASDFVAGRFGHEGMTSVRKLQTLVEGWQIQMLTERSGAVQTALFLGKLLVRYPAVHAELRAARRQSR